jgi:hypothetical protein
VVAEAGTLILLDGMAKHYIQRPVGGRELESLVTLALAEEQDFFKRNPHLTATYRDRLIAAALCQGAALQYIGRGYGVGDFDVHFFYSQNPAKPRLSRAVKTIQSKVGNFETIAVDFIRTVVPTNTAQTLEPVLALRSFLQNPPTSNAFHLARKAVVGLIPIGLFAEIIWPLA